MFSKDFVWGAGSSAYQIEGAAAVEGRGLSVWDVFCDTPGAISRGHTGQIACDHYHRSADDVAIMARLGLGAYRFSISWSRVLPTGVGSVNEPGLAFYDRLTDELLAAGITPWVTLFHWDLPYELHKRGGWLNPDSPKWFAEYTRVIVDRLSDRVKHWITLNEPQIFVGLGYGDGKHAPGLKLPFGERLQIGHNALLAHGLSVQVIRAAAKTKPSVGWAPVGRVEYPITPEPANVDAARRAMFAVTQKDCWNNSWFSDPVCLGHYPADGLELFGKDVPHVGARDMQIIQQPLDFYGVNIYSGTPVKAGKNGVAEVVPFAEGHAETLLRWPITPESLYWGPRFLHERYKLPIVITENGLSNVDWVSTDGAVHDPQRIDYMTRYLTALGRAAADGVDVRGYFHWSIMDNFEWAEGYKDRFGLIYVDFANQRRILKDSARWYREIIASNGASLGAEGHAPEPGITSELVPEVAEVALKPRRVVVPASVREVANNHGSAGA